MDILNLSEKDKVIGEIYKLTNISNGKNYIGQTRSHRLNHKKYRPFGYLGRFKDHISEANSNKKNCSRYLNYALRKYGPESFVCEKIEDCRVEELDSKEIEYIQMYDSKYPNGYNLTCGGKGFTDIDSKYIWNPNPLPKIREKQTKTDYTKALISRRLKEALCSKESRENMMKQSQTQHLTKKYDMFKDVVIPDEYDIDKYIHIIKNNKNQSEYITVKIEGRRTSFIGKYESIETLKQTAKTFINSLIERQRNQIAGNSLEPETTTL